jgi:serine/threonine protein kinase
VKLIDLGIATSSPYQNFLDTLQFIPGFYVAPEHLKDLKERNYEPYLSPKSDIFCLGMITLELACMEPLDSYYNYETFTLDYESLIHRVSKIVYSVELKTLIAGMLEFESDLRIGLISLQ